MNQGQTMVKREQKFSGKPIFKLRFEKLYRKYILSVQNTNCISTYTNFIISTRSQINKNSVKIEEPEQMNKQTNEVNKLEMTHFHEEASGYYIVNELLHGSKNNKKKNFSSVIPPTVTQKLFRF